LFPPAVRFICNGSRQIRRAYLTMKLLSIVLALAFWAVPAFAAADSVPVAIKKTAPQYPFEAFQEGISGSVVVEFVVDTEGNPTELKAVESSGREFEAAAVLCVAKWKFKPGVRDGKKVKTRMRVPIVFDHPTKKKAAN
jgi:TonB family protein